MRMHIGRRSRVRRLQMCQRLRLRLRLRLLMRIPQPQRRVGRQIAHSRSLDPSGITTTTTTRMKGTARSAGSDNMMTQMQRWQRRLILLMLMLMMLNLHRRHRRMRIIMLRRATGPKGITGHFGGPACCPLPVAYLAWRESGFIVLLYCSRMMLVSSKDDVCRVRSSDTKRDPLLSCCSADTAE